MSIELVKPPVNYSPGMAPESRYQRARQEWDERLGSAVVQAANWRKAFFLCGLLTLSLSAGNLYQVFARQVVPFVITVNQDTGEAKVIGRADVQEYKPQILEIRYFLSQLIRYVRALPIDPVVVKQNWLNAYHFLSPQAATALNTRTDNDSASPLKLIGQRTVTVQPISANQIGQSDSYQLRWAEEVFDQHGTRIDSYTMTGVFVVEIKPPKDESALNTNPLGIYVKDFQWSRDL